MNSNDKDTKNKKASWIEVKELDFREDGAALFLRVFQNTDQCYWLDSNLDLGDLVPRYSFMGGFETEGDKAIHYSAQNKVIKVYSQAGVELLEENLFVYLKKELDKYAHLKTLEGPLAALPFGFKTGFVGYWGYELKSNWGFKTSHQSELPDAALFFSTRTLVFDHLKQKVYLLGLSTKETIKETFSWFKAIEQKLNKPFTKPELPIIGLKEKIKFSLSQDKAEYLANIEQCKQKIIDGESYEICLTNRIHTELDIDSLDLYRHLRKHNPAPYSAFLKFKDFSVLSSSPEQFLKVKKDGWISTKPIKGTIKKSENLVEDLENQQHLKYNEKDRAENLMIVDLLRNDLGKVCEIGSVSVPHIMEIESYATLHQLVSTVIGKLKPELTVLDCLEATFPGGSITGAPKIRTMEIIDKLESEARGVYTGSIGYVSLDHCTELNIAIRTAVLASKKISIGVGGAITFLSDPESEFEEILLKGYPLIKAIVFACKGRFEEGDYVIQ